MAQSPGIVAVACYHLFTPSMESSTWEWGYDKGHDKEEIGQEDVVEVERGDLYVQS